MKRVVVFKPGPIGDLLHSLPVVYGIKQKYPDWRVILVTSREAGELVEDNPYLDEVKLIPSHIYRGDPKGLLSFASSLRTLRPDIFIDLKSNAKSFLLRHISGAEKVLFYKKERKKGESETRLHAVENLYRTVLPLGVSPDPPMYSLFLPDRFLKKAKAFMEESISRVRKRANHPRIVVLNPTVGAGIPSRLWPPEHFIELGRILVEEGDIAVFVTGAPGEREYCEKITSAIGEKARLSAGELSLGETAGLIKLADAVVSGDTGPLHIAAAVETPVVGLYGSVSLSRSRPWGEGHIIIKKDLPCVPCEEKTCPLETMQCMKDISPAEVAEAVFEILNRS